MTSAGQDKYQETAFWDRVALQRVYAAFDDSEYAEIFDRALGADLSGQAVIDIGSASGVSASLLAARGATVVGVDISPELIRQAGELWSDYRDRISFVVGDAERLDMADSSVDACFFGGVLHHFPDRRGVCAEAARVTKPGGRFVAIEPNRRDFLELIEWKVAGWRGKLSPNEYPIDPHVMVEELTTAGFSDCRYWTTRQDIPVLAQMPLVGRLFGRGKGYWLKGPTLRALNALRSADRQGTFFVITAVRE
jgi:ubiquinone/menaquinone biosynthesis C-methylase UbiE